MTALNKYWNVTFISGLSAASAVALGAFGAHGLKKSLSVLPESDQLYYLDVWKTASQYHLIHSAAALFAPIIARPTQHGSFGPLSASLFLGGALFFSGSLYTLVLTKKKIMGAIAPIGGTMLIGGWLALALRR